MNKGSRDRKSGPVLNEAATECVTSGNRTGGPNRLPDSDPSFEMPPADVTEPMGAEGNLVDTDATFNVRARPASTPPGLAQPVAGYELLEELGRGGMGVVYKAWQRDLQRTVALKMILGGSFASEQDLSRFRAEAMAIARLHHPHLVSIYGIGESQHLPFYAMEYMEGGSLARRLNGEPISPRVAATLVRSLAQAIDYAHRNGIVHRDLKPANILLSGDANTPLEECLAKITDFGIAKHLHQDSSYTRTGDILGTPHYMAPEQASGRPTEIGPAADVYSLGAILYELITGRPPFHGHDGAAVLVMLAKEEPTRPTQWVRGLPRDLQTICLKCLEKDPARRYASAAALADELTRFLDNEPIQAKPASLLDRGVKWTCRRPALAGLLAMAAGATVLAFTLMALLWRQAVDHADRQDELLTESKVLLADAFLERGLHLAEKGDVRRGIHWMARALAINDEVERKQQAPSELTPIIRMNLASWGQCVHPREILLSHGGWVWDVAFSPDERFVATASRDCRVQIWEVRTGKPVGEALTHPYPVWGLAFHPDGKTLFTMCGHDKEPKGQIGVYSVDPTRPGHYVPRGKPMEFAKGLVRLAAGPQGDRLWIACVESGDSYLLSFDPNAPGNGLSQIAAIATPAFQGVFSHDGKRLAVIGGAPKDGTVVSTSEVRLFDAKTGKPLGAALEHPGMVRTAVFSRDDRRLIVGAATDRSMDHGETSVIQLWDVEKQTCVAKSPALLGRIKTSAVAPNGQMFAVSLFEHAGREPNGRLHITDGHIALYNFVGPDRIEAFGQPLRTQHVVWDMKFSPDSRMLLSGAENSGAYLWSVSNCQQLLPPIWHEGNCVKVAFSRDGRTAVTASAGGGVFAAARLWEVPAFSHIGPAMTQPGYCRSVYWEKDGGKAWIASGIAHCRWDPVRGVKLEEITLPDFAHSIHPTDDDNRFLGEFHHQKLEAYDRTTRTWTPLPNVPQEPRGGLTYRYIREHGILLEGWQKPAKTLMRGPDGTLTGAVVHEPEEEISEYLWCPKADCLVFAFTIQTRVNRLAFYDLKTMKFRYSVPMKQPVHALAFSPDGKTLAFGGMDRQVQRLDVATGKIIGSPLLHEGVLNSAIFVNSDRLLVTCSGKGHVQLWDMQTNKRIGPAFEHHADLISAAVSPDGKHLLTATTRSQAQAWRFPQPIEGDLEQIRLWVETITGMEMTDRDAIVPIDMDRVAQKRIQLAERGGPPRR